MESNIKTPSDFLKQVSPGMIGIREQLEKAGLAHIVCSLLHTYSNHVNEGLIHKNRSLQSDIDKCNARIKELEAELEMKQKAIDALLDPEY